MPSFSSCAQAISDSGVAGILKHTRDLSRGQRTTRGATRNWDPLIDAVRFEEGEQLLRVGDRAVGVVCHGGCGLCVDTPGEIGEHLLREQDRLGGAISGDRIKKQARGADQDVDGVVHL